MNGERQSSPESHRWVALSHSMYVSFHLYQWQRSHIHESRALGHRLSPPCPIPPVHHSIYIYKYGVIYINAEPRCSTASHREVALSHSMYM